MKKFLEYSNPEKEGISSEFLINFLNEAEKTGSEIHGILFIVHGKVIFEAYNAPYAKEIPHIMHSFTKCLTNMALGLAYSNGLIDLDAPILRYLPEYAQGANEYLRTVTVKNLLTMRSGQQRSIGGNEWRPLKSSWLDSYFQVPFTEEPGKIYRYSSGNSYVLSAIVQRVTGKTCKEYLRENITEAIGMSDFTWMLSPEGICSGGNEVSLTVEDMARIGLLYLNGGKWEGKQLLSETWIRRSLGYIDQVGARPDGIEYNYHWEHREDLLASMGMFGQACIVVPEMDMVVAMTTADDKNIFCKILQQQVISPWKLQQQMEKVPCKDMQMWEVLHRKGMCMTLEGKHTSKELRIPPVWKKYEFIPVQEVDGITEIVLTFSEKEIIFAMKDGRGYHEVKAGLNCWIHGMTSMTGGYLHHQYEMDRIRISACAYWESEHTLMMEWRYPEMAFFDHVRIEWSMEKITMKRWVNMNSQDTERPLLEAVIKSDTAEEPF